MLQEVLQALAIRPDGCYVDATFGRGGHSAGILARLGPAGRLYALDRDPAARDAMRQLAEDARVIVAQARFGRLAELAGAWGVSGKVNGVLLDLGVSSPQLDDPARGFAFLQEGPLDMRMDPAGGPSAAQWLAQVREQELADCLHEFGEERFARRIARAIVTARANAPIRTTTELVAIIGRAMPVKPRDIHFATRTFQAIRIAVNRELDELRAVLPQAVEVLAAGGRLAVISFHSLEDRIVKRFMRAQSTQQGEAGLPPPPDAPAPRLRRLGGAIRATDAELRDNRRARSAVLRVAERLA